MVNVREEKTKVRTYERTNGTKVEAHQTHFVTGNRKWGVFYRGKEVVLPGGTKHRQRRDLSEHWKLRDYYSSDEAAERARRALMREGKHAVIINVGAKEGYPDRATIERMLKAHDRDLHERR
jgi:hypothetical protein